MEALPPVTFVVPVLNAEDDLPGCLDSIVRQDYPPDKVEILVVDGGSTDRTVRIAKSFRAGILSNPHRLAGPGVDLGIGQAKGEIVFIMAADNGLPRMDWIRLMVKPFVENPGVDGVYTQIVALPTDNSFTRYYCRLHVEPVAWFVYGDGANPRFFQDAYAVAGQGQGYVIYKFMTRRHPLIAFAHGFGMRRTFVRRPGYERDDAVPIVQMIEDGRSMAYVPDAGIYHHRLNNLGHFIRKYRWRMRNSPHGDETRSKHLSFWRKARMRMFEIYGVTMILPLLDGCTLAICEKDACMLWHGPTVIALSWLMVVERVRGFMGGSAVCGGVRTGPST